jgi:ribonucleoside-triphosphate reductase (thioredoxin)
MDKSQQILSDVVVWSKYAKYIPELNRRETWDEIVDRNVAMHVKKYPVLRKEIQDTYNKFVRNKKVLPSMRSMQFAGRPIEVNSSRMFNCSQAPVDSVSAFSEAMFLLLGGTGYGYSVQKQHVEQLPDVKGVKSKTKKFLVSDSIEG